MRNGGNFFQKYYKKNIKKIESRDKNKKMFFLDKNRKNEINLKRNKIITWNVENKNIIKLKKKRENLFTFDGHNIRFIIK